MGADDRLSLADPPAGAMAPPSKPVQGSLFEEDYLLRTLGSLGTKPSIALAELVANAWDAGASQVSIALPASAGDLLVVEDDGCGLTPEQFRQRWMTLGYLRTKHQGYLADFPPGREDWGKRPAYGRNGVGRHALLCFADEYQVVTRRGGSKGRFVVAASKGREPFLLVEEEIEPAEPDEHGTRLETRVERRLPKEDRIRDALSSRFLHDPRFRVVINGVAVELDDHSGLVERVELQVDDRVTLDVFFLRIPEHRRRLRQSGIAFWVGGRLVGNPSWVLGNHVVADGRTRLARNHTFVVRTDDLFDHVERDWSSFRKTETMDAVFEKVAEHVAGRLRQAAAETTVEKKQAVFREHRSRIESLEPLAKLEVSEFVEEITSQHPTLDEEAISAAVEAVISIERTRSGSALLEKLSQLSEEDIDGLDRLLSEWTVRDALTVLDEIGRRLALIEALDRFSSDERTDELRTLHPLVTDARWLFGPEYDSPEYSSNTTLRTAARKLFGARVDGDVFLNPRKRPDLLVLEDSSVSMVGTEQAPEDTGVTQLRSILLIEVKRGNSRISRKEANQASGYVEDLLSSGIIDGRPLIRAFVVGHEVSGKIQRIRKVGEADEGRIEVCTYGQLVRTAELRLHRLRDQLRDRYEQVAGEDLLQGVLQEPEQLHLDHQDHP